MPQLVLVNLTVASLLMEAQVNPIKRILCLTQLHHRGPRFPSAGPSSRWLEAGISGLSMKAVPKVLSADAMLGEGSGPSKRARVEEVEYEADTPMQATADTRTKRKGQRRAGKSNTPLPLVGMFNESKGAHDSPISVRQMLQNTKVDISWMDLIAWSPAIQREIKRCATRVAAKRAKKSAKQPTAILQQPNLPTGAQPFWGFQQSQQPQQPQLVQQPQVVQQPQLSQQQVPLQQQPQATVLPQPLPYAIPQTGTRGPSQSTQATMHQGNNLVQAGGPPNKLRSLQLLATEAERHTRFFGTIGADDKAFHLPCTVKKPNGADILLDKSYTYADQGSDMNVISTDLANRLELQIKDLAEIGFEGLTMNTADYKETQLKHWVWLNVGCENIWRQISCFVAPQIYISGSGEHFSLLLGIPWLWMVNAFIAIRYSTIYIGDPSKAEKVTAMTGPEMFFCKDHNLLMYPKSVMAPKVTIEDLDSDESEDDFSEDDEASDSEEEEDLQ